MCKAGTLIIESTKLKANANANKSKTKEEYEHRIERINADIKTMLDEAAQIDKAENKQYGAKRSDELSQALRSKELKEEIKEVLGQIQDDKQTD